MARLETRISVMPLEGAVRSLASVEFSIRPWALNIHLAGFGLNAVYQRKQHATLLVQVPFYEAAVTRFASRRSGVTLSSTPDNVRSPQQVQDEIDERNGSFDNWAAREGLNK